LFGKLFRQVGKFQQVGSSGFVGGFRQRKVNVSLVKFFLAPNGSINSDWLTLR